MYRKRILALWCLSIFLIQCAWIPPNNPDVLRQHPGASTTFEVNLPLNVVYANEQRGFLGCMTGENGSGVLRSEFFKLVIQPRINVVGDAASITLVEHGGWTDVWAIVDLQAQGERTRVSAYTTGSPLMKDFPDAAQRWASGDFRCQKFALATKQYPLSE